MQEHYVALKNKCAANNRKQEVLTKDGSFTFPLLLQFMNQTRQGMGMKMDSMGGNPGMRPGMQPAMGGQVSCGC